MSLSERIRPNCEAAPWVVEEVKQLEAKLLTTQRALWKARQNDEVGKRFTCGMTRAELDAINSARIAVEQAQKGGES